MEGKSGTGKTEFVRGLFGARKTLELNCAGVVAVNLRDFKPLAHKVVLWDEASPALVLENRKLFQCPLLDRLGAQRHGHTGVQRLGQRGVVRHCDEQVGVGAGRIGQRG